MDEPLSDQIRAFRKHWTTVCKLGVLLRPEAVQMMDALFASFQGQAKILEGERLGDIAAEARLVREEAREVEDFIERLRRRRAPATSNVVAFPCAGRRAAARPRPRGGEDGGAA